MKQLIIKYSAVLISICLQCEGIPLNAGTRGDVISAEAYMLAPRLNVKNIDAAHIFRQGKEVTGDNYLPGFSKNNGAFNNFIVASRLLSGRKRDCDDAIQLGIKLGLSELGLYYIILEINGITPAYAREINLDQFLWLWMQYIRVADAILDTYGYFFSLEEIQDILEDSKEHASFPVITSAQLTNKGVEDRALRTLGSPMVPLSDFRNRAEILEFFKARAEAIISAMPLTKNEERVIKEIFVEISQSLFSSYLLERKSGVLPSVETNSAIVLAKTNLAVLANLKKVFPGIEASQKEIKAAFLTDALFYLGIIDDMADFDEDFETTPNIFLSIAKEFYPDEYDRLETIMQGNNGVFRGIMGHLLLHEVAPGTLKKTKSYAGEYRKRVSEDNPRFARTIHVFGAYKYLRKRLSGAGKSKIYSIFQYRKIGLSKINVPNPARLLLTSI